MFINQRIGQFLIILGLFAAVLFGDDIITFQGIVTRPDGSAYDGPLTVGAKFVTSPTNDVVIAGLPVPIKSYKIIRGAGAYSLEISLTPASMNTLNTYSSYYLQLYVATGNISNVFQAKYKLVPNVQVLAAPRAFTSRGIYFNNTNWTLMVGDKYKNNPTGSAGNGMVVQGAVGVGTSTVASDTKLSVQSSGASQKAVHVQGNLNVSGAVSATKVLHAKWE